MSALVPRARSLPSTEPTDRNGAIPRLENGDRLTADEFMRRYEAMPGLKKAELIEGVVYVPSPVSQRYHGRPHTHLLTWLGHYEAGTPGVEAGDNSTVQLGLTNTPQPDGLLFIQPEHGGQVRIDEEGYIVGAPTWSPKSPPAASATTCTTSATPTGATASANTSSGVCSTDRSTGSSCARAATSPSPPGLTAPCAARSSPGSGSIRPPSCAATWPPCWPSSNRGSIPPSTRRSRPDCNRPGASRPVDAAPGRPVHSTDFLLRRGLRGSGQRRRRVFARCRSRPCAQYRTRTPIRARKRGTSPDEDLRGAAFNPSGQSSARGRPWP